MKRLSQFLALALIVGGGVGVGLASAETINGCVIEPRTDCSHANLRGAHLEGAHLEYAHLRSADLDRAHLEHAHLEHAYLVQAYLYSAYLDGADLEHASLYRAELPFAHLQFAHLEHAYLRIAILPDAHLRNADLRNADLRNADLRNADLSDSDLDHAKFCRTTMPDGSEDNSGCGAQRRGASAPEPRLGDWKNTGDISEENQLQVQRVKTETQIDNGKRVTVTREDYFRLADFRFSDYIASSCYPGFSAVRIESDGKFRAEDRRGTRLQGEVVNPTTIRLEVLGGDCRGIPPVDLHPVG